MTEDRIALREFALNETRKLLKTAQAVDGDVDITSVAARVEVRANSAMTSRAQTIVNAERSLAWKHVWVALGIVFILGVIAISTSSDAGLTMVNVALFAAWPWLTVVTVRCWNRNDRTRERYRSEASAIAEDAIAHATAYLDNAIAEQYAAEMERRRELGMPAPEPQPFGVSHEGAEALVAEWMRHLGAVDAEVTRYSGDGGIDVESSQYIAQVKNYAGTVGVADIREMAGVAVVDGRAPLFFTSGTLTAEAASFAEKAEISAFQYNAVEGTLAGLNQTGTRQVREGL